VKGRNSRIASEWSEIHQKNVEASIQKYSLHYFYMKLSSLCTILVGNKKMILQP